MARLGDICKKESSGIAQKDLESINGIYPIYGASGFIKNVDFYQQDKPYVAVVKDGAGVGRIMKLPAKSSVIGTMQYIIPNDNINVNYLAYALENMNLARYYTGATIPHIYFKDYCKEILPDHNWDEQCHIAEVLDKVNDLITLRKQQLDKLDELVKARFVEMFGNSQEYRRLEDYSVLITKGASPKWQGVDYTDSGTLFVTSENVREGYLDLSKRKYLDNRINEIQPRSVLQKGDILINIVGASIGRAASYDCEELANINQAVALVRVNTELLNLRFLLTFLNLQQTVEMYNEMKKGGARDNLSLKNIADLSLPAISIKEQERFATFALRIDKCKLTIQQGLDKLEMMKKALMQKYFW